MTLYWPEAKLAFEFAEQEEDERARLPPDVLVVLVGEEQADIPEYVEGLRRLINDRTRLCRTEAGSHEADDTPDEEEEEDERDRDLAEKLGYDYDREFTRVEGLGHGLDDEDEDFLDRSGSGWPFSLDPLDLLGDCYAPCHHGGHGTHAGGLMLDSPLVQVIVHSCDEVLVEP